MKKYPHGLTLNAVCAAIDDYQRHEDSVPEEGILAAFNTLLGHSDIAAAFRSLEQRAEAAEAKLAELAKQKPIGMVTGKLGAGLRVSCYFMPDSVHLGDELFTHPAPAADLAVLVPEEIPRVWDGTRFKYVKDSVRYAANYANGHNACRAEMLRKIEEVKK
ncbi:hypothetical protein N5C79_02435 [Pantoea brenneri]|uniref:hypothetical protein n=1 Tax=Pantoea brenneri TaxID=472694 RepID=UPI002448C2AD|nr:hypothetical protein [Pantoea brenneri]MDH1085348.1 hypothetical protein [Pantoea brenneri]